MTDTTNGPRDDEHQPAGGTVHPSAETSPNEPAAVPVERPTDAAPTPAPDAAPVPASAAPDAAATRPLEPAPATGTVYTPGEPPQPYQAPGQRQYATATQPTEPVPGAIPAAFGGGAAGATASSDRDAGDDRPKRRVGLGVAAAIVAAALIGGAGGAGIYAAVDANDGDSSTESSTSAQNIVVNDTDSVNQITAVAAAASPSVVTISVAGGQGAGTGSGVILSDDGYVLTNTHVVTLDGAVSDPEIQVTTEDGRIYQASIVGTDPLSDLAVIRLQDASGLTPLEFADSDALDVGDTAIAIGAPLGLSGTVTNGIVSALNRSIDVASSAAPETPGDGQDEGEQEQGQSPFDFWNFDVPGEEGGQQQAASSRISIPVIQTDAAINPGNSGGALLDANGDLIGINVAILSAGGSSGEAGNIGVGFAVPSNLAERIANELIEDGTASHGLLGANVTSSLSEEGAETLGALISEVSDGGAAAAAGLQAGDIVTEFNGVRITDQTDLTAQVRAQPGGATAELTFVRDGDEQTVEVTLGTFEG